MITMIITVTTIAFLQSYPRSSKLNQNTRTINTDLGIWFIIYVDALLNEWIHSW